MRSESVYLLLSEKFPREKLLAVSTASYIMRVVRWAWMEEPRSPYPLDLRTANLVRLNFLIGVMGLANAHICICQ